MEIEKIENLKHNLEKKIIDTILDIPIEKWNGMNVKVNGYTIFLRENTYNDFFIEITENKDKNMTIIQDFNQDVDNVYAKANELKKREEKKREKIKINNLENLCKILTR